MLNYMCAVVDFDW